MIVVYCHVTCLCCQTLCLNIPATNYCQMLAEIAEEQGFAVTYDDIAELTDDGNLNFLSNIQCSLRMQLCSLG